MKKHLSKLYSFKLEKRKAYLAGLVIDYNDNWTLLKYNPVDFVIDGYAIVPNKMITAYKRDKEEVFTEKVIKLKGHQVTTKDNLKMNDFTTIVEALKSFGLLQVELKADNITYIGSVRNATDDLLSLQTIKPNGKKGSIMDIPVKDIWMIQFDNDYTNSLKLVTSLK